MQPSAQGTRSGGAPRVRGVRWVVALLLVVLFAAACGSDSDEADGSSTTTTTASTTSTTGVDHDPTAGPARRAPHGRRPGAGADRGDQPQGSARSGSGRPARRPGPRPTGSRSGAASAPTSPGVRPHLRAILTGGRYTWIVGECCAGGALPDDYPTGLLCRDLVEPPSSLPPDGIAHVTLRPELPDMADPWTRPPRHAHHRDPSDYEFGWPDACRPDRVDPRRRRTPERPDGAKRETGPCGEGAHHAYPADTRGCHGHVTEERRRSARADTLLAGPRRVVPAPGRSTPPRPRPPANPVALPATRVDWPAGRACPPPGLESGQPPAMTSR